MTPPRSMVRATALLGALLLAGACAPQGPRFAVDEAVLADPQGSLAAATTAFTAWLDDTLVSHEEVDCYFDVHGAGVRDDDHAATAEAWCGPVLTLDHDERFPWIQVPLTLEEDRVGRLHATVDDDLRPADSEPQRLLRADGTEMVAETLPALAYPEPPALGEDHVERLDIELEGRDLTFAASTTFALHGGRGSLTEVRLTASLAERVGEGRTRRIAPEGHELLVLEVRHRGSLTLGRVLAQLEVDGRPLDVGDEHPLEAGTVLVVVPQERPLSLLVRQEDVEQRLDVRTGTTDRDPRAANALEVGTVDVDLDLHVEAQWTETITFDNFRGGTDSFPGSTYRLDAHCHQAQVSPFGDGWAPAGTKLLEVTCGPVSVGFRAELTDRALAASARLRVGDQTLEPIAQQRDERESWSGDVDVRYRFAVPADAPRGTLLFEGHAEFDEHGLQRFSPAASSDLSFDGAELP